MRHEFIEFVLWKRLPADDQFFCGEPDRHKLRRKQHVELGGNRSDERRYYAGDLHFDICKRFNQREPDRDDHLHADRNQCRRLGHVFSNRYREHDRQTDDQFLHS